MKYKIEYNEIEMSATIRFGRHTVAKVYAGCKNPTLAILKINAEAIVNGLVAQRKKMLDELDEIKLSLSKLPDAADSPEAKGLGERYIFIRKFLNAL